MIVRASTPDHYGWIAQRAGCSLTGEFRAIEAVDAQGRIAGMIGFDCWTPNCVTMHIALDNPACLRSLLPALFDYAFNQADRKIALGVIPTINRRSINLARRVGFREVHRIRNGWSDGEDLVVLEMRREACRYLPRKAA